MKEATDTGQDSVKMTSLVTALEPQWRRNSVIQRLLVVTLIQALGHCAVKVVGVASSFAGQLLTKLKIELVTFSLAIMSTVYKVSTNCFIDGILIGVFRNYSRRLLRL